ncbi:hypothetical protein SUDANB58_05427 [Streptomyces sp. enrichment culture]
MRPRPWARAIPKRPDHPSLRAPRRYEAFPDHRGADEAFRNASGRLDAYANSLYRSVENHLDGQTLAARLDAADSIRFLPEPLLALDRRPRSYDKYLEWELDRHRCRVGTQTRCRVLWTASRQQAT